ncbi:MFS transporter [Amycolatopsis pithecellobii]|uniref:MFS transporter n=1 Tax=Amycolatopsis pithecellobii TaxID=664692 RepID=UPI001FE35D9D|nr:MFS transporter [Amycolatopsis pithecellobii]
MREFRGFDYRVRILLVNQLGIYLGFFMLLPYLSLYLSEQLGLAGWAVGLVLGVRNFFQQGMFLLGGTITDRFGYRLPVILGCLLRTAGFALLGVVTTLPTLIPAAMITGLAGALFTPAVRVGLAMEAGERRIEAFAISNVVFRIGGLAGPLLGVALLSVSFRVACLSAAAVFAALSLLQIRALPKREVPPREGRIREDIRTAAGNRRLLAFAAAMTGAYLLSFQIYLALPDQARTVAGADSDVLVTVLFLIESALALTCQLRVTAWCRRVLGPTRTLPAGMALLAVALLPPALPTGLLGHALAWVPLLLSSALLSLGTLMVFPFEMDTIATMAQDRLVATHYGLYNTIVGIGILAGNLFTGSVLSWAQGAGVPALPWLGLSTIGGICAIALYRQRPRTARDVEPV